MSILQQNAAAYMGYDQDFQILLGNGQAGAPVGLYSQTNVTRANGTNGGGFTGAANSGAGTNSKYPAVADLTTAIYNVENLNGSANVPLGQTTCTGVVGAVSLKQGVTSLTDSNNRPLYDWGLNQMRWGNRADGSSALDGMFGVDTWVLTNIVSHALNSGSGGASAPPTAINNPFATPNPVASANMNPVFFGDWRHVWVSN